MFAQDMLFRIPALLIAITIHEFAHGKAADIMGDPTAKRAGRLTLNPVAHLDPIGLIMLWLFKFGWAKPVPINPFNFNNRRRGLILVSGAGPAANILTAFIVLLLYRFWSIGGLLAGAQSFSSAGYTAFSSIQYVLQLTFIYNLYLAVFNLIPVPPLDGSKILMGFLPQKQALSYSMIESYGPIILVALLYLGIITQIILPLVGAIEWLLNNVSNFIVFGLLSPFL